MIVRGQPKNWSSSKTMIAIKDDTSDCCIASDPITQFDGAIVTNTSSGPNGWLNSSNKLNGSVRSSGSIGSNGITCQDHTSNG